MKTKLSKWGNSLAVRIPSQIALETSWEEGRSLEIEYTDGAIQLRPIGVTPDLDQLLDQITGENVHEEVDFGDPVGNEAC